MDFIRSATVAVDAVTGGLVSAIDIATRGQLSRSVDMIQFATESSNTSNHVDMTTNISSDISLPDLYKYVLTKVLQTNFTLSDDLIDQVHREILREIKLKCEDLVTRGVISSEDISRTLDYQVEPILNEAKRINRRRKFSFKKKEVIDWFRNIKVNGLYTGMPSPVEDYEVLEGIDNSFVLSEIRSWLCDFDNFSKSIGGNWHGVGRHFDSIKDDLKVERLLPGILNSGHKISRNIEDVKLDIGSDIHVSPIRMKLFVHEPLDVTKTSLVETETWAMSCLISADGITEKPNGNIIFCFPGIKINGSVHAELEANVEFLVSKEYKVRAWAVWASLGINSVFNTEKNETFSHRLKLKVQIPSERITLREPVRIAITTEQAGNFLKKYNQLKDVMLSLSSNKEQLSLPPGASLVSLYQQYPWLEFINTLRCGGVDAAMEMIRKKPEVLRNLPTNTNNALGVAFEEIQIAKIMAESIRNRVPLELIAGDGRGMFRYNDVTITTPEYTDAVFRNVNTGEYFAVQFKYTNDVGNLLDMIQRWDQRWSGNSNRLHPDALHHENVRLIAPSDIVSDMGVENIDLEIRQRFEQSERIGFTHSPDDTRTMQIFIEDNTQLLKDIVKSGDYRRLKNLNNEVTQMRQDLETGERRFESLNRNLADLRQRRDVAVQSGENTNGFDTGIANIEKKVQTLRNDVSNRQLKLQQTENQQNIVNENIRARVEENINTNYLEKNWKRTAMREAAVNVAVSAAIDGLITFICTSGDEWKKYKNNEISFGQLMKFVAKETAIASLRGAAFGVGFSGITMAAQYATLTGSSCAGALTLASNVAGPVFIAGMLIKQSYNVIKYWNAGDITTADMKKAFGRTVTATGLSVGGMVAAGTLIGGPVGLLAGAAFAIAVGVGDHFLGDKVWSCVFPEDPKEALALLQKRIEIMKKDVLTAAYNLFNLSEYCTREELKEKYRKAVLKYHPDRGGNAEIFQAVHAAYGLICSDRQFDN